MSGSGIPRYAQGRRAWGECARSGRRMLLLDMVRDPLTDLLVDPAWAEPPLQRPATNIIDGVALVRPAPFLDRIGEKIFVGNIVQVNGDSIRPLSARYNCGTPRMTVT